MNADAARAIPRDRLPALLRAMPKAELHLHIEGTLEPELMFELARRNGVALAWNSVESLRAAYDFADLQSFLDIYYAGASVLVEARDFEDMAMAYFRRAAADRVVHAEVFFDPQTHTARGVGIGAVIDGLVRACERAEAELGVSAALILCFLRHLSEDDACATLDAALPHIEAHRDRIVGVGLDSGERGNPPEKFARVFARCARARPAPRRARRRGGAAGLHRERARRARRRAHRPRRALRRGARRSCGAWPPRACRSPCARCRTSSCACSTAWSATTSPTLLDAGLRATDQFRRPGVLRRLRQRQLPRRLRGAAAARRRRTPTRWPPTASRRASPTPARKARMARRARRRCFAALRPEARGAYAPSVSICC